MIKNLLLSIAVAFGFNATASAADEALNLKMKDGTIHSFILNERPVITMGDGKLYVDTGKTTATYSLYDVSEYAFGEAATGIRGISTTNGVSRNGDNIVFHGVDAKKVVVLQPWRSNCQCRREGQQWLHYCFANLPSPRRIYNKGVRDIC